LRRDLNLPPFRWLASQLPDDYFRDVERRLGFGWSVSIELLGTYKVPRIRIPDIWADPHDPRTRAKVFAAAELALANAKRETPKPTTRRAKDGGAPIRAWAEAFYRNRARGVSVRRLSRENRTQKGVGPDADERSIVKYRLTQAERLLRDRKGESLGARFGPSDVPLFLCLDRRKTTVGMAELLLWDYCRG
jgi:hypothetical protein